MELENIGETYKYPFINKDTSEPRYQNDSEVIRLAILEEVLNQEYTKPILYYGITEEDPDLSLITDESRVRVTEADSCVFPDKYTNKMIYTPKQKFIHWFVLVKNIPIQ